MSGHIYFEIHVDDIQRASGFYQKIFGWKFHKHESQGEIPVNYMRIETGGTAGGMLQRSSETPPSECGTNAFVCSVEVDDYEEVSEKILAGGGKSTLPKLAIPGVCWQGYFLDTEGNNFGIFQVDENAK